MTQSLGVNEYGRTYMERLDRREGSIRTPDRKLARRLKRWAREGVRHHADYRNVRTGRFVCEELRFPRALWDRVAEAAGLVVRVRKAPRKGLATDRAA